MKKAVEKATIAAFNCSDSSGGEDEEEDVVNVCFIKNKKESKGKYKRSVI